MQQKTAIKTATKFVQKVYKKDKNVLKAYLFGSYSRNEQKRWSDIDVCIVYKDLFRSRDKIVHDIWMDIDDNDPKESFIEPIVIDKTDFRKGVPLPYIIKEEGIPLPLT
jgi:predicted nucleotidyltransferase